LPPQERRAQVVTNYSLFDGWATWKEIESSAEVHQLIEFYKRIQLSENDLNVEAFRAKAEYWRMQLSNMFNDPDDELKYAKALENATKLSEEFKIKSELEIGESDGDGIALYLFEIPEDKKPHHTRMKL
jgi:hypothetical protein